MSKRVEKFLIDLALELDFFEQLGVDFLITGNGQKSSRDSQYAHLREKILICQKCHLSGSRNHAVPGEGSLNADLMFVGEAPGQDEDFQGRPFVGKAGQLLTKIINAMDFQRSEVYITNVIKCRPPNNRNPNMEEIELCKDYLLEQIDIIKPRVIVTLGNVPTHFFIPLKDGITSLRGKFFTFDQVQVLPTFHPSYLIRSEHDRTRKKMVWEDMKKVMAFLGKK